MSEIIRERSELDPQYQWDLSRLYPNDEAWEAAFTAVDASIAKMPGYAGKLKDAETVRDFFVEETALERELSNLYCYASLRRSEDTRARTAQSMYARIGSKYVDAVTKITFAEPELLTLPEKTLQAITDAPILADYRFALQELLRRKPHTLTEAEETLLAGFGEVFSAPGDIAENLRDADLTFAPAQDGEGRAVEVSSANYINLQASNDRALRQHSFESLYAGYQGHINTFATAYAGCVKGAAAEARARHYTSSRAMSMAGENIPVTVYDSLITAVRGHLPAMYRYVELRKRLLGVEELHYYDLYAPLAAEVDAHYTYDQAKQMVLDAVAPLGEDYGKIVREGFSGGWIDVYPNKGKSSGAYSSGTYDSNPYILTNFTGTLDSVSTIAHEMGHSVHSWLANHTQQPQYAGYTLFVAEVASTVNENLMIEQLLKQEMPPKARLSLLNQYLENFKGTVYRQTMFAEFEREAHAKAERGEALDPASLNELYLGLVRDYFGPSLVIDEQIQYEWARIPHFFRPFYVYKYATGYSTAVALSEKIRHEGKSAVKPYLEFLSMGGSAYPLDELRHAGVDLATPAPVDAALEKFERILAEAEQVAAQLGK